MALTFVRAVYNGNNAVASISTTMTVAKGDLIVAVIRQDATGSGWTLTDTQGNVYTQCGSTFVYLARAKSSGSVTITSGYASGLGNLGLTTVDYSVTGGAVFYDTSNLITVPAFTYTGSISLTTSFKRETVLFCVLMYNAISGTGDQVTQTSGPTFTFRQNDAECVEADYAQSSAGSVTVGFTMASNSYSNSAALVGLYQHGGAGLLLGVG